MIRYYPAMDLRAAKNFIQENNEQMISIGDVAKLLDVVPKTLRRWDAVGILPATRLYPASRRYYRKVEIMTFIKKKSVLSDAAQVAKKVSGPIVISLKSFGTKLSSSEDGKRAWQNFQVRLEEMPLDAMIEIDFSDVTDFYPDWAGEFLVPLHEIYGDQIEMINMQKTYFVTTLEILGLYRDPYRSY